MTTADLADRLTRLERENRRLKRIGAVVLIGILAVVVMGQAKKPEVHDVLVAKQFVLKDSDGKVRARLTAGKGEATFEMLKPGEQPCVGLRAESDGSAKLALGNRLAMESDESGASLVLNGNDYGDELYSISVSAHTMGAFINMCRGGQTKPRLVMDVTGKRGGSIHLRDGQGREVFRVPE